MENRSMKETIDCLLIGHNDGLETNFENVEKVWGWDSPIYRSNMFYFLRHNNREFSFAELYNYVKQNNQISSIKKDSLHSGSVFCSSIAHIGTFLFRNNLTFNFINSFQFQKKELIDLLQSYEFITIGITTTLYTYYYPIEDIVKLIREYNTSSKIVVGGPFVSNKIKENQKTALAYFNKIGADIYVYSSQGEATLVKIINCLKNNDELKKINNIYYKEEGKFVWTTNKHENNNLEDNTVDWELFKGNLPKLVNVRSAISCPFSCSFCGFPERNGRYSNISIKAIERELNTLRDIDVKSIFFIDDTFNVPQERFKDIMRMMVKNKFQFKWNCYLRCQFVDREALDLMEEAGCEGVNLGLESGSQLVLNNMNKKVSLESICNGLELLNEYSFLKLATFIIGFPGETEQTVHDTVLFIKESKLDYYNYLLWFCDPITPIYREKERFNLKGSDLNWSHNTMDSNIALDLLTEAFLSIDNVTWLNGSTLGNLMPFALHHQEGLNFNQINRLMKRFSEGCKENFLSSNRTEKNVSQPVIESIYSAILE